MGNIAFIHNCRYNIFVIDDGEGDSRMEIKPSLNMQWYYNEDKYSDGDVEDDIIKYIKENEPEDYDKVIMENYNWPVFYHLTHIRKNILNWYPFKKDASVLEIGCGLGAITGLLCDRCAKVTAVELSKRRATAAQLRCREKDNLEIIVGNLNDIEFTEKYDYITLIGVLEYQGTFTDSENPYKDFLMKIKSLLKEDGKLLIAIENKYGAKYWCGATEDHTGIPFDGINQYRISGKHVRTFAKEELRELLNDSGFEDTYFYYPLPDYKLPSVIYSEKYLPKNTLENMTPYYIPTAGTLIADEKNLYKDLIKNNVFEFFANSFLVECSVEKQEDEKNIFALLNTRRQKEYRIGTVINSAGEVSKFALNEDANIYRHLESTHNNMQKLAERGINIVPYSIENHSLKSQYLTNATLCELIYEAAKKRDEKRFYSLWDEILEKVEAASDEVEQKQCIIYEFGLDQYTEEKKYGKIVAEGYLDMIPRNCFVQDNELMWIDQEWILENVPSKYVLFRGLLESYNSFPDMHDMIPFVDVIRHYGIDEHFNVFATLNRLFINMVIDPNYAGIFSETVNKDIYQINIGKILSNK